MSPDYWYHVMKMSGSLKCLCMQIPRVLTRYLIMEGRSSRQPNVYLLIHKQLETHGYMLSTTLVARFMGPTWGPSGADRTQVGRMLAPWTLLSGYSSWFSRANHQKPTVSAVLTIYLSFQTESLHLHGKHDTMDLHFELNYALVLV